MRVAETLTASTAGISDANGKTRADNGDAGFAYTYRWLQAGTPDSPIDGATSSTYRPNSDDQGETLKVEVTFKDDDGFTETVTSDATAAVAAAVTVAAACTGGRDVWSSTLTVGESSGGTARGYASVFGSLSGTRFTIDSAEYDVKALTITLSDGALVFTVARFDVSNHTLLPTAHTLCLGTETFDLADAASPSIISLGARYEWTNSGLEDDWVKGSKIGVKLVFNDEVAPAVESAEVDGTELVITFDEDLAAAGNLANDAFAVKRTREGTEGPATLSATAPVISGKTVTLTLASAILETDTGVKVSYTKPTSGTDNKLKDAADNEVANIMNQAVDNNTDTTAPRVTSIVRNTPATSPTNANSVTWRITFSEAVKDVGTGTVNRHHGSPSVGGSVAGQQYRAVCRGPAIPGSTCGLRPATTTMTAR